MTINLLLFNVGNETLFEAVQPLHNLSLES